MAEILERINERFIDAKGTLENYLTGILPHTTENDDGSCTVTIANAGHPNPLLYVAARIAPEKKEPPFAFKAVHH